MSRFTQLVTDRLRKHAWEMMRSQFSKTGDGWPYASTSKVDSSPSLATRVSEYAQVFRDLPGLPAVSAALPNQDDVKRWMKSFEKVLTDNPGASVAAAFILGSSLGWWVKRR